MRKWLLWMLLVVMLLSLPGCQSAARAEEELAVLAQKELKLEQRPEVIYREDLGEQTVLVLENDGRFHVAAYKKQGKGYKLTGTQFPGVEGAVDCFLWTVAFSDLLVVNNPRCVEIQITDGNGKTECIEVGPLPFVFRYELTTGQVTYRFVDAEGNEVRQY